MWTHTGTLFYRAPEMFEGDYREPVDVWAAGILLYRIVSGRTPFESEYHKQTVKNIKEAELKFSPEFNKFSFNIRALIIEMLSRDIEKRPSADTCLRDLWFHNMIDNNKKEKAEAEDEEYPDKSLQTYHESVNTKCRLPNAMSLNTNLNGFIEGSKQDIKSSVRPYVKTVNGH